MLRLRTSIRRRALSLAAARALAIALAAALAPALARAQGEVAPRQDYAAVAQQVERMIRREMEQKGLPALSVALVDDQQVVWARGFGLANPKDSTPATAETVYRVGSISKLFTDIAVMQMVEQGRLDLDAPVTRALPGFAPRNPHGAVITLRQLMSHRGGLVREPPVGHYFDSTGPSIARTVESLNGTAVVYEPGSRVKYSNAGVTVVGHVLERLHGEPFAAYLRRAVLEPLGMTRSAFERTPQVAQGAAVGHMWTLHGRTFDAPTFELGIAPAGSLYSTVLDLGKFTSALLAGGRGERGQLLRPETLEQMWTPQFAPPGARAGFGIGFSIGDLGGRRLVGHNGAIYGFGAELLALPEEKLGVVVATTMDAANWPIARIASHALAAMLAARRAEPLPEPAATTPVDTALARRLAGRWTSAAAGPAVRKEPGPPPREVSGPPPHAVSGPAPHAVSGPAPHAVSGKGIELFAREGRLYLLREIGESLVELRTLRGDTLVTDDRLEWGERLVSRADGRVEFAGAVLRRLPDRTPASPPPWLAALVGEYGWPYDILYIHERGGQPWALIEWFWFYPLQRLDDSTFTFPPYGLYEGERLVVRRDASGRPAAVSVGGVAFPRRPVGPEEGAPQMRITPVRPVAELRAEALGAAPPPEPGEFLASDLVELTGLDPTIKLDVRYATTNNFLGERFYEQPRAFLQRPAAEALVRAHRRLRSLGYGLLVHDAYRPWYVTKMFWDATPDSQKVFVADPRQGSRHNRGAAVDLTLYELRTGRPVEMPGTYDEFSDRSYPNYPGGTARQRWHRELLRRAMEREGFTVYEAEWWHFDYGAWRRYPISNLTFEKIRE